MIVQVDKQGQNHPLGAKMQVVWHGTAAVEVRCPSGRLLFDPFVPLKGSSSGVRLEDYDGFPEIFVTHGHFDHIASIPAITRRNRHVRVHCTRTPYETLRKKGVPAEALELVCPGQAWEGSGFAVRVFPGRHAVLPRASFSRVASWWRSPFRSNLPHIALQHWLCRENGETVFYHVEAEGKSLSLMGSLNLRDDVAYPRHADLLVLPCNGWEDVIPPAVRAIERLEPRRVLLDHYDDAFPPVTGPVDLAPLLDKYGGMAAPMAPGMAVDV